MGFSELCLNESVLALGMALTAALLVGLGLGHVGGYALALCHDMSPCVGLF